VSKAYGLHSEWVLASLKSSEHPTARIGIADPNLTPAATVMSPSALSRYGSAGEFLEWLPIETGHAALHGVFHGIIPGQ
jgi:hypothetical protein